MTGIAPITDKELLCLSAETLIKVEAFVKVPKLSVRELASLAGQILKEMGRNANMVQLLFMMGALRQLREENKND